MKLTEEQIIAYEGKEIDEIRKDLQDKGYSPEEIKIILSEIDDWRIENAHAIMKRRQGFTMILAGTAISLISASVFLVLYFRDEFQGKISMFIIILLSIGYLLIRAGRMVMRKKPGE